MAIRFYKSHRSLGESDLFPLQCGNFNDAGESTKPVKAGDVIGVRLTAGQVGAGIRLSGHAGGQVIAAASGVAGIAVHSVKTDSNGVAVPQPVPTGINPSVWPNLSLGSYAQRMWTQPPVAGAVRSTMLIYPAVDGNLFIQRHKVGTRVNQSLVGKACDLTWNDTTLEWEVDTTTTTLKTIIIREVPETYADNLSANLYDSATFATDTKAAWLAFEFDQAYQFFNNGSLVRYA